MTAKLIYPAFKCGRPHVAEATVEVRLTPKQVVVLYRLKYEIVYVNGYNRGPTGIGPHRYWRGNGAQVSGHPMRRSWQLADGELERLDIEAGQQEMR